MSNAANTVDLSVQGWLILDAMTIVFAAVVTLIALPRLSKPLAKSTKILVVSLSFLRLVAFSAVLHSIESLVNPGVARATSSSLPWHFYVLNVICLAVAEEFFGRAFPDLSVRRVMSKAPESESNP